jgi:urease accessory protein
MSWLSPAYPVGAFSYSSGLEWAVEAGDINDADTLQGWLRALIACGGGFCDGVFFVHAHAAVRARDDNMLSTVAELASAFAPSAERQLETTAQGRAFIDTTLAAWPCKALKTLRSVWPNSIAYPVAARSRRQGTVLRSRRRCTPLHAVTTNLVSAGVRLVPLGQTDGQRAVAALAAVIADTAARALATPLDDVGAAVFRADIASMRHETQYTRLFRS